MARSVYVGKGKDPITDQIKTMPAPSANVPENQASAYAAPSPIMAQSWKPMASGPSEAMGRYLSQLQSAAAPVQTQTQAPDLSAFEKMKGQVGQRFGAQQQQAEEAIKRRFASMGGLNTGAAMKSLENVGEQIGQQREAAIQGIDFQAAQEGQRQKELQQAQRFQAEESAKGRLMAAAESGIGREFASSQADLEKQFARENLQVDLNFKQNLADFDRFKTLKGLDMAEREFARDTETLKFNKELANRQLELAGDQGGFLGMGSGGANSGFLGAALAPVMGPLAGLIPRGGGGGRGGLAGGSIIPGIL